MCSKLKLNIKWHRPGVFVFDFDKKQHISIVFLLLTLNKHLSAGCEKQLVKRELMFIFVNFLENKHFFTLVTTIIFYFILRFWGSATLLTRILYLYFQVAFCNQPTIALQHWKWYGTETLKPYSIPLWTMVSVLWFTLNFGKVSKTYKRMH